MTWDINASGQQIGESDKQTLKNFVGRVGTLCLFLMSSHNIDNLYNDVRWMLVQLQYYYCTISQLPIVVRVCNKDIISFSRNCLLLM